MDFAALLRQAREEAAKGQTRGNQDRAAACAPALASLRNAEEGRRFGCRVVELLPGTCWYCADFVSAEEADALEVEVRKQPWEQLSGRKLQNWGGVPHPSGTILEPMPTFVDALATRLHATAQEQSIEGALNASLLSVAGTQDGVTIQKSERISLTMRCVANVKTSVDEDDLALDPEMRREVVRRALFIGGGETIDLTRHNAWVAAARDQEGRQYKRCNQYAHDASRGVQWEGYKDGATAAALVAQSELEARGPPSRDGGSSFLDAHLAAAVDVALARDERRVPRVVHGRGAQHAARVDQVLGVASRSLRLFVDGGADDDLDAEPGVAWRGELPRDGFGVSAAGD
ncbi:Alpha-ketoglutarate-dependent dioxygenase alkB-like 6 [Hondaea fermentalgiana]|uniref:Alpha-ketoglutarate-dependent dioxygenase alkB-like 6 n=1 Tax=Hondaea fermentalgiana TaxID=2315210 RepID=A0A2R5GDH5_9STRA|nr:Alpha-ketoglutarate-dependent dioxygenase alkB-like 6 [Hondaea fermentalgiana]|eukprot:GBG29002.1 Alpha-ketoglutarate-dependent dioxygenase alkB-like 6 [Hondaea fermentalgiana]